MTEQSEKPKETETPNNDDTLEKFGEIKEKYENVINEKDKEIAELKKQLEIKDKKVDDTIANLNDEVKDKLAQAEKMKELQASVNELLQDKSEALVDKYITQGKLAPAQREQALNLCLADQDMFISLYENAPSIIDTNPTPRSNKVKGNLEKLGEFFKN